MIGAQFMSFYFPRSAIWPSESMAILLGVIAED